jgi:hypothetical protein
MSVRFKADVRVVEFTAPLVAMLDAAARWSLRTRVDVEINSIDDGAAGRVATSLHGFSLAIDFDTVGDKGPDLEALADFMRRELPPGYDLVYEGDHLHVEFDMHRPALRVAK